MDHSIYRIIEFEVVGDHVLRVEFDDRLDRIVDFEAVLKGEMFEPFKDRRLFAQVELDPETHARV